MFTLIYLCCPLVTTRFFEKVTIANDKGTLRASEGRKAVNLSAGWDSPYSILRDCLVAEGDRRKLRLQPSELDITCSQAKPLSTDDQMPVILGLYSSSLRSWLTHARCFSVASVASLSSIAFQSFLINR